jgi:hypothetical protein
LWVLENGFKRGPLEAGFKLASFWAYLSGSGVFSRTSLLRFFLEKWLGLVWPVLRNVPLLGGFKRLGRLFPNLPLSRDFLKNG